MRGRPFVKGDPRRGPGGRPKENAEFRTRARKAVDAHVLDAWIAEVESQGESWVKCSELLAAYGYGKPAQPVTGADGGAIEAVARVIVLPDNGRG
jgi:hypothetical protein